MAHDIINVDRRCALDAIESVKYAIPEHVTEEEIEEMKRLTNIKYDTRIRQYDCGKKQWDTNVSVIMVICGTK
jgi:hypothetical protein